MKKLFLTILLLLLNTVMCSGVELYITTRHLTRQGNPSGTRVYSLISDYIYRPIDLASGLYYRSLDGAILKRVYTPISGNYTTTNTFSLEEFNAAGVYYENYNETYYVECQGGMILDNTGPTGTKVTNGLTPDQLNGTAWIKSQNVTLGVLNLTDTGSGLKDSMWKVNGKDSGSQDNITLGEGNHTVSFSAQDNVNNSTLFFNEILKIDGEKPEIKIEYSDSESKHLFDESKWISKSNLFVTATATDTNSLIKEEYWSIDGKKVGGNSKQLDLHEGSYQIKYTAIDNAGNSKFYTKNVNVDYNAPTTPLSPQYSISGDNLVISWSGGSDIGGSGISQDVLFIDYGTGVYSRASTNVNSDYDLILSSLFGKELKLKSESIDKSSKKSIGNNEVTLKIPHKMEIASLSNNVFVSQGSFLPTYSIDLKLSYDARLNFTDGSYDLVVSLTDKNGDAKSFAFPITTANIENDTFSFSFSGIGFDERNATFKLRTKLNSVVINESSTIMKLKKYGSDVSLSSTTSYSSDPATIRLTEKYSNVGVILMVIVFYIPFTIKKVIAYISK